MSKYTTEQLQAALIGLYARKDDAANDAYRMTFDELHCRMGDDAFDKFLDANNI